MTFVITAPCIADYSCVESCPVDAIWPTPDDPKFAEVEQLYIDPIRCIDCAACVEACPVNAIHAAEHVPIRWISSIKLNADYFEETSHV